MRIFITGATGFIGSRLTAELIGGGHDVIGLARSDAAVAALAIAGADAQRGSVEDFDALRSGVARADAVIHLAFNHDVFEPHQFASSCENDRRAIEAMGAELEGSKRPFLVTSGVGAIAPGWLATEADPGVPSSVFPRGASEEAVDAIVSRGARASVVRLPQVHDPLKQGLVSFLIKIAKEKGVSAYVDDGAQRWAAAHVANVANLYRLAIERNPDPGTRFHAVGEEGVPLREIAEAVARRIGVPAKSIRAEEAPAHFGWFAGLMTSDLPASSAWTREQLGWDPSGPGLISDLDRIREVAVANA